MIKKFLQNLVIGLTFMTVWFIAKRFLDVGYILTYAKLYQYTIVTVGMAALVVGLEHLILGDDDCDGTDC